MEDTIYEKLNIGEIIKGKDGYRVQDVTKNVIAEISLKVMVDSEELVSVLCLNQYHEELALGFLYNEGVISSYSDIESVTFNDKMLAVMIKFKEGVIIDRQESLRSLTSGCGKCYTYINPLKKSHYKEVKSDFTYPLDEILAMMNDFVNRSRIYIDIGGVHSVLLHTPDYEILIEDIGRHNCFDKIAGLMMKENKMDLFGRAVVFVSGRVSSEIMAKIIRMGVPILVSKSTPTTAAVKLAQEHQVTLLGYVREHSGYIYSWPERVTG
ncbi:MAG TPA: formate dehydrogenase accessory sulfurtransferase FdhD [Deltaproteobacteria bacterium]|nr:formate dehydrogenase accessory sulfurtransferase FdhD [Deltaproteobacteria bacterium]